MKLGLFFTEVKQLHKWAQILNVENADQSGQNQWDGFPKLFGIFRIHNAAEKTICRLFC